MKFLKKQGDFKGHAGSKGFTLIEILVVLTLLGTVLGALYTSFRIGLRARQSTQARAQQLSERRWALTMLEDDLNNLLPGGANVLLCADGFSLLRVVKTDLSSNGDEPMVVHYVEAEGGVVYRQEEPLPQDHAERLEWRSTDILRQTRGGLSGMVYDRFSSARWSALPILSEFNPNKRQGRLLGMKLLFLDASATAAYVEASPCAVALREGS